MNNILDQYTKPKITKAEIARACGVGKNVPGRWRNGVPKKYVLIVSKITGIPVDDLRPDLAQLFKKE